MIYTGGIPGTKYEDERWYLNDPDYNTDVADEVVAFFENYLSFTTGSRWKGKPFKLQPWQEHRIIRPLFGILREPPSERHPIGLRRIQQVYVEVPKKTGKSELVAGIGVKMLCADFEPGAEVYTNACDREQASIIHSKSASMIINNSELDRITKTIKSRKRILKGDSVYVALSSETETKHGLNVHACLFDELHAQPNSELWDVMTEGSTAAREQPLIFSITTAGYDRESICWKQREYALKVMKGEVEDDTFLPVIYGMDSDEDWENEDNWRAVNPSMDVIFSFDDFKRDFEKAKEMPYKQNKFRRLRLNQWTQQESRFIPMDKWDALPSVIVENRLKKKPCFAGVDLSYTTDLTASTLLFPSEDTVPYRALWRFWIPEEGIQRRRELDGSPYDVWVENGVIQATPGNVIDYKYITDQFQVDGQEYEIVEVGYDPHNATQWVNEMQDLGFNMVPVRQGYLTLSPTTKELLSLILRGELNHGGNPVARQHADNMVVKTDPAGNIKPDKHKRTQKIDGMISLICALDCALRHPDMAAEHGYAAQGFI